MDEHTTLTSESIFESSVDWPTLCCVRIQTFKQKYEIQGYNWTDFSIILTNRGTESGPFQGVQKHTKRMKMIWNTGKVYEQT